jgi:hypothetical protein
MSRVSRVNVDVTATTSGLESGMRRAEQRVEGFGKRVDGMKASFEKLRGVVGFGIAGFGVAWAVENTIGQVWKFARGVEAASTRASKALEELRKNGTPLGMSGLTPTAARSLEAIGPAASEFNRRASYSALSDIVLGEATSGQSRKTGEGLRTTAETARAFAAILGSGANAVTSGRLGQALKGEGSRFGIERIMGDVVGAIGEAVAGDDQAEAIAIGRGFLRSMNDPTYVRMLLGGGAR